MGFFLVVFTPTKILATCEDKPGDGVDYSNCQFADEQNLSGTYNLKASIAAVPALPFNK